MTTWVLVHSPLLGPASWTSVAAGLPGRVVVPDLSAALDGRGHARAQAELVAAAVGTGPVTLVAHSGAGPILPVVASTLAAHGGEVTDSVFVDAGLPHPGRSRLDVLPEPAIAQIRAIAVDGWVPPWPSWWSPDELASLVPDDRQRALLVADCPRLPETLFTEPLPDVGAATLGRCHFVQLSDAYAAAADTAERAGWPVYRLASTHLGLLTDAGDVIAALLDAGR